MARTSAKLWYDAEGDFLEVMFEQRPGVFRQTRNPHVMEKIDCSGNTLGFSIMAISALADTPLDLTL